MHCEKISLHEDRDDVTLTTYVLDDSSEMVPGRCRPAILICPGGAYLGCSDREAEPVAMAFAAMGYHAFVLRYSVYFDDGFEPIDPEKDYPVRMRSVHPGPMRDIGQAMLAIHKRAKDWLVDPEKIVLCGFSAGGHNCAMYSVYWNRPPILDHFGQTPHKLRPAAAILGYPLSDYEHMKASTAGDEDAEGIFRMANLALFGTPEPDPDLLRQASPARLVHADTAPMFIWSTAADALVPVSQSTLMAHALAEQGIPFELHIFEDGPHGLSTATQSSAGSPDQVDLNAAKWLPLCQNWLAKRFALRLG